MNYNIGMKMPVLMHQAGLADIQARISDAVRTVFPPLDTPDKESTFNAIGDDGLGAYPADDESFRKALAYDDGARTHERASRRRAPPRDEKTVIECTAVITISSSQV